MPRIHAAFLLLFATTPALAEPTARTPKEGLQQLGVLIGSWRGTGEPLQGTTEERRQGFWIENIDWQWNFQNDDVCLTATIARGKHYSAAQMRYVPEDDLYRLTLKTVDKKNAVFEGRLSKNSLTLERTDEGMTERLTFSLLHGNRHLYSFDVKQKDKTFYKKVYRVGATREGVDFATGDGKPECIVSGGLGTSPVTYKGKTYYVCCSGCRDAFNDDPEKYIEEYEASKKAKGGR